MTRIAKNRKLTLTDEAWAVLTDLASAYGSRSAVVERWCAEITAATAIKRAIDPATLPPCTACGARHRLFTACATAVNQ